MKKTLNVKCLIIQGIAIIQISLGKDFAGGDQRFLLVENCGACVKDLWFCKPYLVHGQGAR